MIRVISTNEIELLEEQIRKDENSFYNILEETGKQIAHIIDQTYSHKAEEGIFGIIGKGIKSLYSLASLLHLAELNWTVSIYILDKSEQLPHFINKLSSNKIHLFFHEEDDQASNFKQSLQRHSVWLESLTDQPSDFIHPHYIDLLEVISEYKSEALLNHYLISINLPSWINYQYKESFSLTLQSDLIIAIGSINIELLEPPVLFMSGEIKYVEVEQYKAWFYSNNYWRGIPDSNQIRTLLSSGFNSFPCSNKNVLMIDGSISTPISPALSALAFQCIGSPPLRVALPSSIYNINATYLLDAEWLLLPHELGAINEDAIELIDESTQPHTIVLWGSGLEVNEISKKFFIGCLTDEKSKSASIGLVPRTSSEKREKRVSPYSVLITSKVVQVFHEAGMTQWHTKLPKDSVILLYPDELPLFMENFNISNNSLSTIVSAVEELSAEWQLPIVYLSNPMIVTSPQKNTSFVPIRTSILSFSPNTVSILLGLMASFLQRSFNSFDAAVIAVWIFSAAISKIHTNKGKYISINPQDIINNLSPVLTDLS